MVDTLKMVVLLSDDIFCDITLQQCLEKKKYFSFILTQHALCEYFIVLGKVQEYFASPKSHRGNTEDII